MTYSEYDRFKWEVLAELFHRFGTDSPWAQARKIEPEDDAARAVLVRRVVLDLLDSGLIFGAYASRRDGYNLDFRRADGADTATPAEPGSVVAVFRVES